MAQVPEKVLAWLYSVLHEYHDPQRTYTDAARTLAAYPSLSPRTEVYTAETGSSSLLLTLSGTLPVAFRGTTYRFPVKLWIPQAYPQEAPIAYVTPGNDMRIRPGQHVGVEGRIYHPYLRDWQQMWDRASLAEFLSFLQQVFAKEPPVISKAQQQQFQRPIGQTPASVPPQGQSAAGASIMPPQLPPKQRMGGVEPVEMPSTTTPPPRPPKPGEEYAEASYPRRTDSRSTRDGPPLPPLPHERPVSQQHAPPQQHQNGYATSSRPVSLLVSPPPNQSYQNGRPPGPLQAPVSQQQYQPTPQHDQLRAQHNQSPVSPVSPISAYARPVDSHYSHPPPLPQQQQQQQYQRPQGYQQTPPPQQGAYAQQAQPYQTGYQQPPPPQQQHYPSQHHHPQYSHHAPQPQKAPPPPDLLSDPFDVALPGPAANGPPAPAPPIPPNPEREHLLQALSTTLTHQAQTKISQNLPATAPLHAQNAALLAAYNRLEAEINHLTHLSTTLSTNESILRRSIADCDRTISSTRDKPLPPIDEVLVAPTVVAQQLWNVCAEEAGVREAMYVLQKALDRGRVSGVDFVRGMRGFGREAFGKMVLARKCGRGLGVEVRGGGR